MSDDHVSPSSLSEFFDFENYQGGTQLNNVSALDLSGDPTVESTHSAGSFDWANYDGGLDSSWLDNVPTIDPSGDPLVDSTPSAGLINWTEYSDDFDSSLLNWVPDNNSGDLTGDASNDFSVNASSDLSVDASNDFSGDLPHGDSGEIPLSDGLDGTEPNNLPLDFTNALAADFNDRLDDTELSNILALGPSAHAPTNVYNGHNANLHFNLSDNTPNGYCANFNNDLSAGLDTNPSTPTAGSITPHELRTQLNPWLNDFLNQQVPQLDSALLNTAVSLESPIVTAESSRGSPEPTPEPTPEATPEPTSESTSESTITYVPRITLDPIEVAPEPKDPLYPEFQNIFQTGEAAKAHRKQARGERKSDPHAAYVKKNGRWFWVKRIYTAMIDCSMLEDGIKSTHYNRFAVKAAFETEDIEATAHQIFEKACAVHERGWNRYAVYHKEAVRGSLVDVSKNCVEQRLQRICQLLRKNKSLCNDALQGGLTLAQLVDNPYLRAGSKGQNNKGNLVRGKRLQAGRRLLDGSVPAPTPAPALTPAPTQAETPGSAEHLFEGLGEDFNDFGEGSFNDFGDFE